MPRKAGGGGAKGYRFPERLPEGLELKSTGGSKWRLGAPLAKGGFGEIYSATEAGSSSKTPTHVIKIEPHENGPLFVEMHFYMRNAKKEDVDNFLKSHKIKHLGMPIYIASGSHEHKNIKYRFIVMDRFGKDLWSKFLECGRIFPVHTVFQIALQMLNVYEYIHSRTYVHADLKGGNILFGFKKGTENHTYLVDFGLASHYSIKDFKVDPKKAHNGTLEYTSRDAHNGVPTRRGDMEILGYNLIQWLTGSLPWETDLRHPKEVQIQKEKYMSDVPGFLRKTFPKSAPPAIVSYLNYVSKMDYDETPDYNLCRSMFESGLKSLGYTKTTVLDFTPIKSGIKSPKSKLDTSDNIDSSDFENISTKSPSVTKTIKKRKLGPKSGLDNISSKLIIANKTGSRKDINKKLKETISDDSADLSLVTDKSFNVTNSSICVERSLRSRRNKSIDFNNTAHSVDIFEDSCIETPPKTGTKRKHKKRFEVEYCTDEEVTVHTVVKKKSGVIKQDTKSWKKFPTVVNGRPPNKTTC